MSSVEISGNVPAQLFCAAYRINLANRTIESFRVKDGSFLSCGESDLDAFISEYKEKEVCDPEAPGYYERFAEPGFLSSETRGGTFRFYAHMKMPGEKFYRWYEDEIIKSGDEVYTAYRRDVNDFKKDQELKDAVKEQSMLYDYNSKMLVSLSRLVEFRNVETSAHVSHVAVLTEILLLDVMERFPSYRVTKNRLRLIKAAALMHDIGKMTVPDQILNKPGRLTEDEFNIFKSHTISGARIIERMRTGDLDVLYDICYDIALHHHERFDGKGYPEGLKGSQISIGAQAVGVADVYDALVSERCYKKGLPFDVAEQMIIDGKCGCFNKDLLVSFEAVSDKMREVYESERPLISTAFGRLKGNEVNGVVSFKGVPFAKPPVGSLRWKAPVMPEPSNELFDAAHFGASCFHKASKSELEASQEELSEDCLTLNIWTAGLSLKKKPVLFFIHGSLPGFGGTSDPLYNGEHIAREHKDVIVVTANYRTGLFGFADFSGFPGCEEYPDAGYLGILDQIAALKWVKENIGAFGGDPSNVTVFGEGTGAASVSLLMCLKGAEGLFNRAIAMSGSIDMTYTHDDFKSTGALELFIKKTGAKCMDDLAAIPSDKLFEILNDEGGGCLADLTYLPLRGDGSMIPEDPWEAFDAGKDIDFMAGSIGEEISVSSEKMACAHIEAGGSGKTYMYSFRKRCTLSEQTGICRGSELSYVFHNLEESRLSGTVIPVLADKACDSWVNFAACGDPSGTLLLWPQFTLSNRETMCFNNDCSTRVECAAL